MIAVFTLLTLAALAALLVGESREQPAVAWVAKPLASTGFVAVAVAAGALDTAYGRAVLLALGLCWLGDVLLIPKGARVSFLLGLVSFLLGHLAYLFAFAQRQLDPAALWIAGGLVALAAAGALRWLWPHVPRSMVPAVVAYVVVISGMVVGAAGAARGEGLPLLAVGALCFYVSDLAVARERFVVQAFSNRLWGLPLYYGGQLLLAATVAS